jgi:hypothetical protein
MTRNKLYLMLAATVAASTVGLAGVASASTIGGGPPVLNASDFKVVETAQGGGGVYSVTNNSTGWYITAFAVTNPSAQNFFAFAETGQDNWEAGKFCNGGSGTGCSGGGIGVNESGQFAANQPISSGLGDDVFGFYYYNLALEGVPDSNLSTLLSTSLGPGTKNDNSFRFFNGNLASEVQLNLVDGAGDTNILDFPASSGAPEPASWALMIGGFGLAGAALRRRRAVAA